MNKPTHKQKLALRNIWGRYKYYPVSLRAFQVQADPMLHFVEWIMRDDPCPREIRTDIERARTIDSCMRRNPT